jgi:L-amino acid N-acyltransferase YncA
MIRIEPLTAAHAEAVLAIYQAGLDDGDASFETTAPSWVGFDADRRPDLRYVATIDGTAVGWIACRAVSPRAAYRGVVEHSVFVAPTSRRHGAGGALLETLLGNCTAAGVWTVQSSVFPENTTSLALHQRAGFRLVGVRERIGRHRGVWRDTVLIEWRNPAIR